MRQSVEELDPCKMFHFPDRLLPPVQIHKYLMCINPNQILISIHFSYCNIQQIFSHEHLILHFYLEFRLHFLWLVSLFLRFLGFRVFSAVIRCSVSFVSGVGGVVLRWGDGIRLIILKLAKICCAEVLAELGIDSLDDDNSDPNAL